MEIRRRWSGAAVVLLGDEATAVDLESVGGLRARHGSLTVVQVDRSAWLPSAAPTRPDLQSVLHVTATEPFTSVWHAATDPPRRPVGGRR